MNDEHPVPLWHIYFDKCDAVEEATGEISCSGHPGTSLGKLSSIHL